MTATSAPEAEARRSPVPASDVPPDGRTPTRHDDLEPVPRSDSPDSPALQAIETTIETEDEFNEVFVPEVAENGTPTTLRPAPQPSTKRRESQAALMSPEIQDGSVKKRKRAASPPWQFPTAEMATLKTADGRRISARFNAATPGSAEIDDRSRSVSQSASKSRPASPPWKKFAAEGPTSINVDGRRKSGRVNKELTGQPKRVSPRSKKHVDRLSGSQTGDGRVVPARGRASSLRKDIADNGNASRQLERPSSSSSKAAADGKSSRIADLQRRIAALQPSRSFDTSRDDKIRGQRRRPNSTSLQPRADRSSSPPIRRRTQRLADPSLSPEVSRSTAKIKLRFNAARHFVEPPHPQARMPSPARPPRLSLHQLITKLELQEMQQPFLEHDKELPDQHFFDQRAIRQATEESVIRQRLVKELGRGGVLSRENLSLFQDDRQPEPAQQYGHHDHLVAHALFLRQLQQREKAHHRLLAKKLANEAVEYWRAVNGPTEEDLVAEQAKILDLIKKQVVADMDARWKLVEIHVQDIKRAKWEAEQEMKRAERLQKKLQWSENLLARQRGELDSDVDPDEDSTGDVLDSDTLGDGSERSNGDSSDDVEDDDSLDENMSETEGESDGSGREEDEGEMDDETLTAYLAQREADINTTNDDSEEEDQRRSTSNGAQSADGDADGEEPHTERKFLATDGSGWREGLSGPEDQPDQSLGGEDKHELRTDAQSEQHSVRGRRREYTSVLQSREEVEVEKHLSSDESTNMDSEDYDSDENMSSSDDDDVNESSADDDDAASVNDSQEISRARGSLLALYSSKDFARERDGGLPTPVTSVENEGDNENTRSSTETQSDEDHDVRLPTLHHDLAREEDTNMDLEHASEPESRSALSGYQESEPVSSAGNISRQVVAEEATEGTNAIMEDQDTKASTPDQAIKTLVPSPSLLRGKLRSYQHAGLDWLASLYRNGTNGILADEMGLGKTIQTIAVLAHLAEVHEVWDTHLVIVPTSVILNWVTEFQKFLPGFRVLGYYGTSEERQNKRRGWVNDPHHENKEKRGYNVIITSYNVAMQDINAIRNVQWHYLILDEAHNIRNFNSQRWQVLIRLRTRARLLLTGTPLQNNLAEVWSLLTFLTAGDDDRSHGELEEFLGHWKDPVKEIFDKGVQTLSTQAQKVVDQLHVSLRPFLLRRKKSEVEKDLPKKTERVVVCKLSKRQRQLYQDYMGLAEIKATLAKGSGIQAGAVLLSLRRVCNHPDLFDPRPIQTSFAMERSVLEGASARERLVRHLLGTSAEVPEPFLVTSKESNRLAVIHRSRKLDASALLRRQMAELESKAFDQQPDTATLIGVRAFQRLRHRERKSNALRACIQITDRALQITPIYGTDLRELVTVHRDRPYHFSIRRSPVSRALHGWPVIGHRPLRLDHPSDWHLVQTSRLQQDIMTLDGYADRLQDTIVRFAFVPPAVTAPVLDFAIPPSSQDIIRHSLAYPKAFDHAHEARVRTSIAFPDSRLLIYDSGKLQRLTYLLRDLQSKGSRSLIFTQMTGTLNILEQFLSLLNIPYLRLDGSTPVERRQLYSAEFNRPDSRYQCMILSSRAGGVGLNLTGASSVIFYDLDWNPQMDRQCMDRAHRIGQVRDVEVFKMVSEKTVEENILRRANQKSLLDQTVIQEGHFTTDHPTRQQEGPNDSGEDQDDVSAAIERFLGGGETNTTQALESVEDKEDVDAAQQARKEDHQDDIDFAERSSKDPSKANTPAPTSTEEEKGDGERSGHIDLYMIRYMEHLLKDQAYLPPPVRKLDKNGRDPSHRPKKRR